MSVLTIVPHAREGARVVEWTADDAESVTEAQRIFTEMRSDGMAAYTRLPDGTDETVSEFDPDAASITLTGPLAGG